jgi:hypothetical protein
MSEMIDAVRVAREAYEAAKAVAATAIAARSDVWRVLRDALAVERVAQMRNREAAAEEAERRTAYRRQCAEIVRLFRRGERKSAIARKFGKSSTTITTVIQRSKGRAVYVAQRITADMSLSAADREAAIERQSCNAAPGRSSGASPDRTASI